MDETATCREYVRPRLESAGWNDDTHLIIEQKTFTDGRIVPTGRKIKRRPQKRADYLLCYTRDFPIAVVEAKAEYKLPGDGLQQAKDYAETLGVKFAYATNGQGIIEYDYFTGQERELHTFPSPGELWARLRAGQGLDDDTIAQRLLTPSYIGEAFVEDQGQDKVFIFRGIIGTTNGAGCVPQPSFQGRDAEVFINVQCYRKDFRKDFGKDLLIWGTGFGLIRYTTFLNVLLMLKSIPSQMGDMCFSPTNC